LINSGAQGVGADAPFDDAPFVQTWGRPETSGTRFVFNMGFDIDEDTQIYLFGNNAQTEGRFRFFYRPTDKDVLIESLAKGAENLGRESEAGYTPFLDGDQSDASYTLGLRGVFANETTYDASISYGINQLDYTLNNSLNGDADLVGSSAVRNFETGDFEQEELTVNIDFGTTLSETLFLGYGVEYREETFTQKAGDQPSYVGGGSSGLAGTRPADAGENSRDNYAVYADLEHDITDDFMLQYALRYEDFSDFGSTLNGKIAGRYSITDSTALRGAVSTGFHAPTPGQSNLRSTTTTFDNNNNLIEVGLLPADSAEAAAAGAEPLTEEEAVNISIGITSDLTDSTTLTIDAYQAEVDGRIYRTEIDDISFYTNALDVEHQGIDVVLTQDYTIGDVDNT
jgi:iron complex outermembrane receptor protein